MASGKGAKLASLRNSSRIPPTHPALSNNEKDMRKMAQIERLIEAEVPRLIMPESIGVGPEWKISSGPKKNFKKKPFKKKFKKVE